MYTVLIAFLPWNKLITQLLWVQHQTFIDLVSTEGCTTTLLNFSHSMQTITHNPSKHCNHPLQTQDEQRLKSNPLIPSVTQETLERMVMLLSLSRLPPLTQVQPAALFSLLSNPLLQQHLQRYWKGWMDSFDKDLFLPLRWTVAFRTVINLSHQAFSPASTKQLSLEPRNW
jgi:hypothetical protein